MIQVTNTLKTRFSNFLFQALNNSIKIYPRRALQRYSDNASLQFSLSHNTLA